MSTEHTFIKVDDFVQEETVLILKGKHLKKISFDQNLLLFQVKEEDLDLKFKIT